MKVGELVRRPPRTSSSLLVISWVCDLGALTNPELGLAGFDLSKKGIIHGLSKPCQIQLTICATMVGLRRLHLKLEHP